MSISGNSKSQGSLVERDYVSRQNIFLKNLIVLRISLDAISFRSYLVELLTAFILILLIVQEFNLHSKTKTHDTKKTGLIFFLFLFYVFASSIFAHSKDTNFLILLTFQLKALLFILVLKFSFRLSKLEISLFRDAILRILVLSALLGVCEFLLGRKFFATSYGYISQERFSGLILWPNVAAILYGFGICALLNSQRRTRVKLPMIFLLVFGILTTNTITGTIATVVALVWILRARYIYFLLITAVSFLVINFIFPDNRIFSRIENFRVPNFESIQFERSSESYTWRLIQWQKTWRESRNDLLFGKGFGFSENTIPLGGYLPHNDYLRIIYETGIVGLLLFLSLIRSGLKVLKFQKLTHQHRLSISCVTIILISSISENVLGQLTVYLIFPFFINSQEIED